LLTNFLLNERFYWMNDFAERTVFMKDYFWEKERNIDGKLLSIGLSLFNSNNSYLFSCSRNAQVTVIEKRQLKAINFKIFNINIYKFIFDQTKLLRVPLWIAHCHCECHLKLQFLKAKTSLTSLNNSLPRSQINKNNVNFFNWFNLIISF